VQLLTKGSRPPFEESRGVLSLMVPSVDVHEVIAIDF
jgi:hypothetical protein